MIALAAAESTNDTSPSDTFVYADKNFTFTITANTNGDIWFSMAAPATYGWFAVGTGSRMAGSLMFVAYGDGTPTGMHWNCQSKHHANPSPRRHTIPTLRERPF
jgi:hypothetical protein